MKCCLVVFVLFLLCCVNVRNAFNLNKGQTKRSLSGSNEQNKACSSSCLECGSGVCSHCEKGKYSIGGDCVNSCPKDSLADNYTMTCKSSHDNPVFIKAHTFGRCLNMCGHTFTDCSCKENCKKKGTCCSDYKYCEIVKDSLNQKLDCQIQSCKACSNDGQTCLMCEDGFYLHKNKCISQCPQNTQILEKNKICLDKSAKCEIDNCGDCEEVSGPTKSSKCKNCIHGFFLHDNKCVKSCPKGTRANRIDFTCVDKSNFAFYMVFPSKTSCKDQCGKNGNDCSCHHHCLKNGNCCDDFEQECTEELNREKCKVCKNCLDGKCSLCEENANLVGGKCICKEGYMYDFISDQCIIKNKFPNSLISNQILPQDQNISQENLGKILLESFKNYSNNSFASQSILSPNSQVFFNGNTTMNIFSGNDNPSIVNENTVNENSYNNSTYVEKNINSKNIISGQSDDSNLDEQESTKDTKNYKNHLFQKNFRNEGKESNQDNRKIVIDKNFHLDHPKIFQNEDNDSETNYEKENKSLNVTKNNSSKIPEHSIPFNNTSSSSFSSSQTYSEKPSKIVEILPQNLSEKNVSFKDFNKKVQVNINIPGSDNFQKSKMGQNKVTVYNHYFINDKSMTMNQPQNPKVYYLEKDCKSGECLNEFEKFEDPKFISDKNFQEFNQTYAINKTGVNIVMNDEDKFPLPKSQKNNIDSNQQSKNLRKI